MANQEFYGRRVSLLVGPNKQDGRLIENLRVVFKIEKNLEKHPNPAVIQVYNLSATSRGVLTAKNGQLLLSVGYGDDLKGIFKGTVAKVTTKKQGPDIISEIEAGDGDFVFGSATINQSFAPGATFSQVLGSVTGALGLTPGQQIGTAGNTTFAHGLSLSGMAKDALTSVLGKQGLEWSIQDEQLQILPPKTATSEEAVVLSPATGLIGSPYDTKVIDPLLAKPKDGKVAESGIKLLALLNPEIRPGRLLKVQSRAFPDGQLFRCYKVIFNGDTHGPQWYAEVEAHLAK